MHESIQKLQSNNDSVTDDMLILVSQKFKEDKELCLGNDNENDKANEISYKKDGSATDKPLLLGLQKSEENQG